MLNTDLLLQVRDHILGEPDRLNMEVWIKAGEPNSTEFDYPYELHFPECGTVGCIAGWTVLLGSGKTKASTWDARDPMILTNARLLLNLNVEQAMNLFFVRGIEKERYALESQAGKAKMIADKIDKFIHLLCPA